MASIWGPVLLGGMTPAAPGKMGSVKGGVLTGTLQLEWRPNSRVLHL